MEFCESEGCHAEHPLHFKRRTTWQKSSRCATSTCVEVMPANGAMYLRDSKLTNQAGVVTSPLLKVSSDAWPGFLRYALGHSPASVPSVEISRNRDNVTLTQGRSRLVFTLLEWKAFMLGIKAKEFDLDWHLEVAA